jgi:hypothetical protein
LLEVGHTGFKKILSCVRRSSEKNDPDAIGSGPGGQSINKTSNAVSSPLLHYTIITGPNLVTHLVSSFLTGLAAICKLVGFPDTYSYGDQDPMSRDPFTPA